MTSFDAYEILEIERDADVVTVRRAYQKLARRYHPDVYPGDLAAARRFADVERAYRILGDPERRRRHDAGLASPADAERSRPDFRARRRRVVSASYFEVHTEITETRRRERRPLDPPRPLGPLDMAAEVTVDFGEAVRGTIASLSVQRERRCDDCGGSGRADEGAVGRLPACGRCSGRGVLIDLERVRARLPTGVDEGARLRLAGRGRPDPAGGSGGLGSPGDLYLTVRVRPHSYFRRDGPGGLDVHADLPLTFAEAVRGAEVDVPTLDGPVRVRVPPGTPGGQRFRLPGRGVRSADGSTGDHYYRIRIVVPTRVSDDVRELLEMLPGEDPRAGLPTGPV